MTDEEFESEKMYCVTMALAEAMCRKGIITEELLAIIDTKLTEKYRPSLSLLLPKNTCYYNKSEQL